MAEVIAATLLEFVLDKVASNATSKLAELINVDEELGKLESTLSTIRDVLEDAETRQGKEKALTSWLRKLKDLAYEVDDVLDEFAYETAKLKSGTESHMMEKVRNFLSIPENITFLNEISRRVKEINMRLDEIAERRSKFHLKVAVGGNLKIESSTIRQETGSFIKESQVYGRQKDKEKIVESLLNTSIGGDIGVIGIVGLGGLGKTTLAQLVYNNESVCRHFEKKMWVCVSEEFEIKRLVGLIIESATKSKFSPISIDAMEASLIEQLEEKRFLLVLDDVWSEDHEKWDRLRTLLEVGAKGSKVIVTTRSERVAFIMGAIPLYRLSSLSLDDCWLLFERIAFPIGVERNQNLDSIGREIVKKCGGVPLAAKALGSLLRFKKSESVWQAIKDSELWKLPENENCKILPALKLSYDHLSPCLKQCFAYCSMFPKHYEIYTDNLVKLWGAEGFLKPYDEHMHWEQIGLQYVDELLARSLFQKSMKEYGKGYVTMHDLVHDLAQSVAGNECSIVDATTGGYLSQNSRYAYYFTQNQEPSSAAYQSLRDAKKLRTLYFLFYNGTEERVQEAVHVISSSLNFLRALKLSRNPLKALPDSFKKLKHLRYLNLSYTHLEFFPPCINTLHNLQTLDLNSTRIKLIPDSIANLQSLCTLDLSFTKIESLPESICTLSKLRTLNLCSCISIHELPQNMSTMKSLCTLDLSFTKIESLPESICTLSNLHTLYLFHCSSIHELPQNMSNMKSLCTLNLSSTKIESLPESICTLSNLHTLNLERCSSIHELPQNMSNMKSLCTLDLSSTKIESLPESICTLSNLRTLDLNHCSSIHELPQKMSNMKSLCTLDLSFTQIESLPESICTLSNLHTLNLFHCSSIHELPQNMSNMKSLCTLDLSFTKIESLPESICTLSNLHTLNLKWCSSIHELPQNMSNMKSLCTLDLSFTKIESLPESICTLSNLHTLNLKWCSSIHELPQNMSNMKSLCTLDLSITKIESLPESICTLSNLHTLNLNYCSSIHKLPQNMSNMKSLVHLDIGRCHKLTCIPRGLGKLNRLRTLPIFIVGGETNCSLEELGSMKLEGELEIKELQNVRNVDEAKGANLSDKHSIRSLKLSWERNSYKNPEQAHECDKDDDDDEHEDEIMKIQHAEDVLKCLQPSKNLEKLEINGYVGRTFPFWMMESSLPNLKTLGLFSLPLIKHLHGGFEELCSVGSEQLFPCLEVLTLDNCPKLNVFNAFSSLKQLKLLHLASFEVLCSVGSEQLFPCLKVITLDNCPKLKALPSVFNAFPSLKKLELRDLTGLEEWCGVGSDQLFTCIEVLTLDDCPKLKALPSIFNAFPSLKLLQLYNLTNLEEWCSVGSNQLFPCLEELTLYNCPKLKALPSDFPSVKTVCIMNCDCLRVFNAFPSLQKLELFDLTGLEELCSVGSEQPFPCLEKLSLNGCPKLKASPSDFLSVKEVYISN